MISDALTAKFLGVLLALAVGAQAIPGFAACCPCSSMGCSGPETPAIVVDEAPATCCSTAAPASEESPDEDEGENEGCCQGTCRCTFCGVSVTTLYTPGAQSGVSAFEHQIGLLPERPQALSARDASFGLLRPPIA